MSEKVNQLFSELYEKTGMSREQLEQAAQSGDPQDILKNADSETARQAQSILNDPEKTRQILNSPQAKAILKLLES